MILSVAAMTTLARRAPNASPVTLPALASVESSSVPLPISPGGGKRPRLWAQIAAQGHRDGATPGRGRQVQSPSPMTPSLERP